MKAVAAQQNIANQPTCASALSVCQSAPTYEEKRTDAAQAASVFVIFEGAYRLLYKSRFYLYACAYVQPYGAAQRPSRPPLYDQARALPSVA